MKNYPAIAAAFAMISVGGIAHAGLVDFETTAPGLQVQGFSTPGHSELRFFSINGGSGDLEVGDFADQGDGIALAVNGDHDGNYLRGVFSGATTSISLDFGNDDGIFDFFSAEGDLATLQTFRGATFVGQATVVLNRDDIMNQTISFVGSSFDSFTFAFTNPAGSPFTGGRFGGLVEIVDNISYGAISDGVPEPASWALMIVGLGLGGAALRRRRTFA